MPRPRDALTPFRAPYAKQRHYAGRRGIEWLFTLETWAETWTSSGKWEMRGQGDGRYCMARNGDKGPYSPSNVRIILSSENGSEAFENTPYLSRKNLTNRPTGVGGGKGYYFKSARRKKPWFSVFRGKHLGYFETEIEARNSYVSASDDYLISQGLK